jgi:hypothetical protein
MSWRRFMALLRGLSPVSATVTLLARGDVRSRKVNLVTDREAAQRTFEMLFKPRAQRVQ